MTAPQSRTDPDVTPPATASLSPSRAADFMTCPLRYRYRVVDRLPEPPGPEALLGTLVHAVLDRLFDLPAAGRTVAAAEALLAPEWERLRAAEPAAEECFADEAERAAWLSSGRDLLAGYFLLEDPRRLAPAERERYVEAALPSGLTLRGYVDRLDRAADGALRVVDYKTGRSPAETFESKALFQLKFYALVIWRSWGVLPRLLQLLYLGDREVLRYVPDEADLRATERKLEALWAAIRRAEQTGDWRARPGRLCDWCPHKGVRCPAWPVDPERVAAYDAWAARHAASDPASDAPAPPPGSASSQSTSTPARVATSGRRTAAATGA